VAGLGQGDMHIWDEGGKKQVKRGVAFSEGRKEEADSRKRGQKVRESQHEPFILGETNIMTRWCQKNGKSADVGGKRGAVKTWGGGGVGWVPAF